MNRQNGKDLVLVISMLISLLCAGVSVAAALDAAVAGLAGSQTVTTVPIDYGDYEIFVSTGSGVPPDPGEEGKLTIGGIDVDADNIRDDVERRISQHYPDNPTARAYTYLLAMKYQEMIENPDDAQRQLQIFRERALIEKCLEQLLPDDRMRGYRLVRPWVLDTYERSYAYIRAKGNLGGLRLPAIPSCNG